MTETTFKTGDTVMLNSGDLGMTVETVGPGGVVCVWREGQRVRTRSFAAAMLRPHGQPIHVKVTFVGDDGSEETLEEFRSHRSN